MSDLVLDLLNTKGILYRIQGNDYITNCFNPEHSDRNPSFRVDKISGIGHCFSCGFKFNIFKHFNITGNFTSIRVAKLKEKLKVLAEHSKEGVPLPKGYVPYTKPYRGLKKSTLTHFDAGYTTQVEELASRIIIPITDTRGKVSVYVCRHTESNAATRYINYPSTAKMGLFPYILEKGTKSIIIVEGIFDLINLYDKGIKNAVCTFGTSGLLNNTKDKLLPYKVQGVTKVIILYDGDNAGNEAATKLKPLIEECEFEVEIVTMEDGTDPGSMSSEDIESMKEYYK